MSDDRFGRRVRFVFGDHGSYSAFVKGALDSGIAMGELWLETGHTTDGVPQWLAEVPAQHLRILRRKGIVGGGAAGGVA